MSAGAPVRFRFWADIVPISVAWVVAMTLAAVGVVLIIGIITAPLGLLLILWSGRIAGKSMLKHTAKLHARRVAWAKSLL